MPIEYDNLARPTELDGINWYNIDSQTRKSLTLWIQSFQFEISWKLPNRVETRREPETTAAEM